MKGNKANDIVSIRNIFKSFRTGDRSTQVLKDVSLDLYSGEFLIIFGPSGCGKSTVLHTIMGLEMPDKGEVLFEGIDMWKMNSDDRADARKREMGIMYQQQNWIKSLTVRENLAFSAQLLGFIKEEALEKADIVLEVVGMAHRKDYIPTELSSGEQQKIGLARSLIAEPKIIIADEPTGNLDVTNGLETIELLKELVNQGISVIMVTHNPEYLPFADRVAFMVDGKIFKEVTTENLDIKKTLKEINIYTSKILKENKGIGNKTQETAVVLKKLEGRDIPKRNILEKTIFFFRFLFLFFSHILVFLYLKIIDTVDSKKLNSVREKASEFFKGKKTNISPGINSLDLTEVSFKNLMVKKSRTYITVLGISMGIGFIVFLLSIGYGLEKLILTEITTLKNQNQIDISPLIGGDVILNDESIVSIKDLEGVGEVFPIINSACRVTFNQAKTDVVAYGVENKYLTNSASKLIAGNYFSSDSDVVINEEYLNVLGLQSVDIIGKPISLSIVTNANIEDSEAIKEQQYNVVGVLRDDNSPVIYLPILQMKEYIPEEYSSLNVLLTSSSVSGSVRKQIEVLGYETSSVMDTITQVESLFKYIKVGLALLGTFSFIIAVLGMVNTLTVSLLERTKEVGLMKTIGMKSNEIRTLFINESMLMGLSGGIVGIFIGLVSGFFASLIISLMSISRGGEFVWLTSLPWYVILLIIVVSTTVGYFTGLYPSNRAVKIAPLDALRYE